LLHQWRLRYASIIDDVPAAAVSTHFLVQLAKLNPPVSEQDIVRVGLPSRLTCQISSIRHVLNDKDEFFERVSGMECHNCINLGHAAIHCPFPKNKPSGRSKEGKTAKRTNWSKLKISGM
jgi:hypothetical protein